MEHVDHVADVQPLPQPPGLCGVGIQREPLRLVLRSDGVCGIAGDVGRRGDVGNQPAVGVPELQLAIRPALDLAALLVDSPVVSAAEQTLYLHFASPWEAHCRTMMR